MSTENSAGIKQLSLIIFTCENREHLIVKTYQSFKAACKYPFAKVILAVDGKIDPTVIDQIQPDVVVQSPIRKGYINNILQALNVVNTDYFFWLEDDWKFNQTIDLNSLAVQLTVNPKWAEIVYSKDGALLPEQKAEPLATDLYNNINGFSANPCLCRSDAIKVAFHELQTAPKGDKLGEDGFENFLTRYFARESLLCVIHDPKGDAIISHEGYLESTPRNWHMTNSLTQRTEEHLLTIPRPPFWRKVIMAVRLTGALFTLTFRQFFNNEIYELCFRVLASEKNIKKNG